MRRFLMIGALLALAGCEVPDFKSLNFEMPKVTTEPAETGLSRAAEPDEYPETVASPASPAKTETAAESGFDRSPLGPFEYQCTDGLEIVVKHPDPDHAFLGVSGRTFMLYRAPASSGIRYATEEGLRPGNGLIWWAKGREALLIEMIKDHSVSPDDYPVIASCRIADY